MDIKNLKAVLIIAATLVVASASAGSDKRINSADAYFDAGNYNEAFRLFRDLAEQGNAIAQHSLGEMYFDGLGTSVDVKRAAHWYKMAAVQGSIASQIELARILYEARGVERDKVAAYVWLDMAARSGNWKAGRGRNLIARSFHTSIELGEARSRAERCYASGYTNCD